MINIAIDGPSGAGKSTVAKLVAAKLGITYLDTGAMYRACALYAVRNGVSVDDEEAVKKILQDIRISFTGEGESKKILLNGEDVSSAIREHYVSKAASDISKLPSVRDYLVAQQRKIASETDVVLDGRDITSNVLPHAEFKFFLTASADVRAMRKSEDIVPVYKMVDTCAAEFEAQTPYFYSTYGHRSEAKPEDGKKKVVIVGGGPIRIGQGIEFDYCCVHGVMALQEEGVDAVIINNNPETVSTDYDISDRLYFEPLTLEDVLNVIESEDADGVICQYGGQTSVNLAVDLERSLKGTKTRILGTTPDDMDVAEDRRRFSKLMDELGIKQPKSGTGYSFEEAKAIAEDIGYPVLVRPSYVLGGRAMEIVYSTEELKTYVDTAVKVSRNHPILIDKYLTEATEIDVDCVCDGTDVYVGGIMEHVEYAGCHSGTSSSR